MNDTPTPWTDANEEDGWNPCGWAVDSNLVRELERELTAAREEIERLECAGIHSCHDNCERPNCVLRRQIKALTEQRDGLHELHNKNAARSKQLLELCGTLREQRDRLAEALERIADYQGRFGEEDPESIATEALQSLNQDHTVDANDMIAAVKGDNHES